MVFNRKFFCWLTVVFFLFLGFFSLTKTVFADWIADLTKPIITTTITCNNDPEHWHQFEVGGTLTPPAPSPVSCTGDSAEIHIDYSDQQSNLDTISYTVIGNPGNETIASKIDYTPTPAAQTYNDSINVSNSYTAYTITVGAKDTSGNEVALTTYTLNFIIYYSIGGTVFVDNDKDGVFDAGEPGYPTASLSITGGGSVTSNASGVYNFTNLISGSYTVTLTIPAGYGSTTGTCSTPRTCKTTTSQTWSVPPSTTVLHFGIAPLYTISGIVFVDYDHDGVWDLGESGYNSSGVNILSISGVGSEDTSAGGYYEFADILNGDYTVTLSVPSGYGSTTGSCSTPITCKITTNQTAIVNGASAPNINFGITPIYTITASVYEDTSCPIDYTRDPGESGYPGATVTLSDGSSGTTNSSGIYVFSDVLSGDYNVDINAVSNYTILTTHPVSIAVGPTEPNPSVTFIIARNWAVSGTLYNDVDDSGTINIGDTPFTDGARTITATHVYLTTLDNPSGSSSISDGKYSIATAINDDYTLSLPTLSGYKGSVKIFTEPVSVCNGAVIGKNFLIQGFTISGVVNIDHDQNGSHDVYDEYLNNAILALSGGYTARGNTTTNASGYYIFHDLKGGVIGYNVAFTLPAGYQMVSANPVNGITLGPDGTVNFYITPLYTISGNVFKDNNKNHIKDAGESNYGPITITSTGGTVIYPTAGVYKVTNLISGSYTISYTPPLDYEMTHPKPPTYIVRVGKDSPLPIPPLGYSCNANPFSDPYNTATCYQDAGTPFSGSIQNLNFGISNSCSWSQIVGGNRREDGGINICIPPPLPPPPPPEDQCIPVAGISGVMSSQHGVFFSGNNPYSFCLGGVCLGRASANRWIVGGITDPEPYSPVNNNVIRTSYNYFRTTARQNGIAEKDFATVCPGLNCTLPADIADGAYLADGNLTLTGSGTPPSYTFPASRNIVILVNGTLTINTNLLVPIGSSVTFSTSGDIHITREIGVEHYQNCNPITHQYCNIEGFYSTDGSFILDGYDDDGCSSSPRVIDSRLNIAGSVVVNAGLNGGAIVNNRDLCENNLFCPSYSITERPDLILNAPEFLKVPTYVWNEAAP